MRKILLFFAMALTIESIAFSAEPEKGKENNKQLAIIIDDVGANTKTAKSFSRIKAPLTFAVLPFLSYTKKTAEILKNNGYKIIMHVPMEGSKKTLNENTDGIITTSMQNSEIGEKFEAAIKSAGSIDGFNNHMGSKYTENKEKMDFLLDLAIEKKLFYVDSHTSQKSIAYELAKKKGIRTASCSFFLDNKKELNYIKHEIKRVADKCKNGKKIVAIGHYNDVTAQALYEMMGYIDKKNIKLVFVEEILE